MAVEDVGLDLGLGVHLREEVGVAPVGGALAAVEQAGGAELEARPSSARRGSRRGRWRPGSPRARRRRASGSRSAARGRPGRRRPRRRGRARRTGRSRSGPGPGPGRGVQTRKSKTGVWSSGCSGSPHTSTSEPSPNGSAPSWTITATVWTGHGGRICGMAMVAQCWQKINVGWHSCHSWQDHIGSMITAMTFLLILLAVAAVLERGHRAPVITDGRGPQRPRSPTSRTPTSSRRSRGEPSHSFTATTTDPAARPAGSSCVWDVRVSRAAGTHAVEVAPTSPSIPPRTATQCTHTARSLSRNLLTVGSARPRRPRTSGSGAPPARRRRGSLTGVRGGERNGRARVFSARAARVTLAPSRPRAPAPWPRSRRPVADEPPRSARTRKA